ncbi:MAG: cytochrome c maturation protein CcmE [Salinisphaeraceae bacterium]|nr:cytochrome c maturation protein CcmE [Salinisphaeraceae bacterium]
MTRRQQRMTLIALLLLGLAAATGLMIKAFEQNLLHFYTPTQVAAGMAQESQRFRLGGMVQAGSVQRAPEGLDVTFVLEDCEASLPVSYRGILPDLFREGQGIVAQGSLNKDGVFIADEVLAKHDENYMPPELAESLMDAEGTSCMPAGMLEYENQETGKKK